MNLQLRKNFKNYNIKTVICPAPLILNHNYAYSIYSKKCVSTLSRNYLYNMSKYCPSMLIQYSLLFGYQYNKCRNEKTIPYKITKRFVGSNKIPEIARPVSNALKPNANKAATTQQLVDRAQPASERIDTNPKIEHKHITKSSVEVFNKHMKNNSNNNITPRNVTTTSLKVETMRPDLLNKNIINTATAITAENNVPTAIIPKISSTKLPNILNASANIPNPPSMPTKVPKYYIPTTPITPEILQTTKTQLKSITGKLYETSINKNTTVDDISDENLKKELLNRNLTKEDSVKTFSELLDINGNKITVGESKNNIKITSLFQAYQQKDFINNQEVKTMDDFDLVIGIPPKPSSNTFIKSGEQKHLLIAVHKSHALYYAVGYLTSYTKAIFFADMQYKKFENLKEGVTSDSQNLQKNQYMKKFSNLQLINPKDLTIVKYYKEYLAHIGKNTYLEDLFDKIKKEPIITFNTSGFTKQNCLDICKAYDKNVLDKKPHPKTKNQQLDEDIAKGKQKQNQTEAYQKKLQQKEALDKQNNHDNVND
jgi:hypothetical protein